MINKNTQKNTIGYSGIVKISVMKGKSTVKTITHHNEGTIWLFKLLSSVLCGNNESGNMPKYFDLGNIVNNGFETNLAHRIPLNRKMLENFNIYKDSDEKTYKLILFEGAYGASFTAMIPSIQILDNTSVSILRLYSTANGGDEVLIALVDLGNNSELELSYEDGYNYMIEWIMTFENALKEYES